MFSRQTREDALVRVLLLTGFGIALQIMVLLLLAFLTAALLDSIDVIPIRISDTGILVWLILVNPIYCLVFSSIFKPKRIISPLQIHIGTLILFMLMVANVNAAQAMRLGHQALDIGQHLLYVSSSFFAPLFWLGYLQNWIVKRVIGVNPPDEPLDQKTYVINAEPEKVAAIINTQMKMTFNLKRLARGNGLLVYRYKRYGRTVVLVIGRTPRDKRKTVLATVPCEVNSSITRSIRSSEMRTTIVNDLWKRLEIELTNKKERIEFDPQDELNDEASKEALEVALRPSKSRVEDLRETWDDIPAYHRFAIVFAFATAFAITAAFLAQLFTDLGTYLSIIILVGLVLVVELGVPLREEMRLRKHESLP